MGVTGRIKERALELGFDAVGVAAVGDAAPDAARFMGWLAAGRHGGMEWLATERSRDRRADPARVLPGARSMVCVALCHEPAADAARDGRLGRLARYAAGEDYHRVMDERLGVLERDIERLLPGARALAYADTGAILERAWARRAGLGWIGKHAGLLSPTLGSWLLLGEVLVDRELEADAPFPTEHCGACARCLEACPTRAIVAPGSEALADADLLLHSLLLGRCGNICLFRLTSTRHRFTRFWRAGCPGHVLDSVLDYPSMGRIDLFCNRLPWVRVLCLPRISPALVGARKLLALAPVLAHVLCFRG